LDTKTPTMAMEKKPAVRFWHQPNKYTTASVRHTDAIPDEMMVTQLMEWRGNNDCDRFGDASAISP
jgi:hypothetical protein